MTVNHQNASLSTSVKHSVKRRFDALRAERGGLSQNQMLKLLVLQAIGEEPDLSDPEALKIWLRGR